MIRIALIIGQLGLGGAEKQLFQLATQLPRWHYHPCVIALSAGEEWVKELRTRNVETFVLSRNRSFSVRRLLQVVKILLSFKPEIVYGFGYSGSIYGRLAGAIVGVPILIGRVQSERIPPSRVIYAERLLRRKTDTIISNSFAGKRTWTELFGYPPEKVAVVQNGFNFEEIIQFPEGFRPLRELIGLSDDEPLVGCIGSMSIFKNPLMFIDVATAVIDSGIKAHFVWIGDGPMRQEVERVVAERHLGGMVHLLGHQKDACWLARDFCIGILTSIIEGTPNVILEYMYCGLPIVATNVGDGSGCNFVLM